MSSSMQRWQLAFVMFYFCLGTFAGGAPSIPAEQTTPSTLFRRGVGLAALPPRGVWYCRLMRLTGGSDSDEAGFVGGGAGEFHDWADPDAQSELHEEVVRGRSADLDGNCNGPPSDARPKHRVRFPSINQGIPPQQQQMMSNDAQQGPDNEQARLNLHTLFFLPRNADDPVHVERIRR